MVVLLPLVLLVRTLVLRKLVFTGTTAEKSAPGSEHRSVKVVSQDESSVFIQRTCLEIQRIPEECFESEYTIRHEHTAPVRLVVSIPDDGIAKAIAI